MAPRRSARTRVAPASSPYPNGEITALSRPKRPTSDECPLCHLAMPITEILNHVKTSHAIWKYIETRSQRVKVYRCPGCNDPEFYRRDSFGTHFKRHFDIKDCLCHFCPFTTMHAGALTRHLKHQHTYKPLKVGRGARRTLVQQQDEQRERYTPISSEADSDSLSRSSQSPEMLPACPPQCSNTPVPSGSNVTLDYSPIFSNYSSPTLPSLDLGFGRYESDTYTNVSSYANPNYDVLNSYPQHTSQMVPSSWFGRECSPSEGYSSDSGDSVDCGQHLSYYNYPQASSCLSSPYTYNPFPTQGSQEFQFALQ